MFRRKNRELFHIPNLRFSLSHANKRTPNSSNPTKTNHEPGVNGERSAANPKRINKIPKIFLYLGYREHSLLNNSFILCNSTIFRYTLKSNYRTTVIRVSTQWLA